MNKQNFLKINLIIKNNEDHKHYFFTTKDIDKIKDSECVLKKIKDFFESKNNEEECIKKAGDINDLDNTDIINNCCSILFIKANNKMMSINVNDIVRLQAARNYCDIIVKDEQVLDVSVPMNEVLEELDETTFYRINRSCVININYIKEISGNMIKLNDESTFLISDKYRKTFFSQIKIIGTRKRTKCCLGK